MTRARSPLLKALVLSFSLLLALATFGCDSVDDESNPSDSGSGTVILFVRDSVPPNADTLDLTITRVRLFRANGAPIEVLSGTDPPVMFDLLAQVPPAQFELVNEMIPDTRITGVELRIADAILTFTDATPDVDLITSGPVIVSVAAPFRLKDGQIATILLHFDADASLVDPGTGIELTDPPVITLDSINIV